MKIFKLFATDLMQRQSDHLPQFYQHMMEHDHENTVMLLVKKRDVIGSDFYRCCQAFGKLSDQFNFEKFILEPLIGSILRRVLKMIPSGCFLIGSHAQNQSHSRNWLIVVEL